jgi:AcrR family transcriptional regulator
LTDRSAINNESEGNIVTPKIVDRNEKKNLIIRAAIRVFSKMGFARSKMIQVAEAAGIGKGTIYEYFKSKEDLIAAVFNTFVQEIEIEISKKISRLEDPVDKLRIYFNSWLEILNDDFLEYGDLMIDIWAESVRLHEGKDIFDLKGMYQRLGIQLASILNQGITQKRFKSFDTTVLSSVILATMDGLFLQWLLNKKAFNMQDAVRQISEILIEGILIKD